ncbi:hypothetical protein DFH09DRAFT_834221, partial [Mycena vulgaris]
SAFGATYSRSEHIVGLGFCSAFDFEAISDPTYCIFLFTHNCYCQVNTFVLQADSKTVISDSSNTGRNSVRIQSKNAYMTHVAVFDIVHMPEGCWSTWPALWENGPNWPNDGEVGIIEGVNNQGTNQVTLHTALGSAFQRTNGLNFLITSLQLNCDTNVNSNAGCGV